MSTVEDRRVRLFVRILLVQIAVMVLIVASVWISSYQGRSIIVDNNRRGCERSKQDRVANAAGWRNAERARRASGDEAVAEEYAAIAEGLENRSQVDCTEAYPDPKILQFR